MQRCRTLLAVGLGIRLVLGVTQPGGANAFTSHASAVHLASSTARASVMLPAMTRAGSGKGGNLPGTGNPPIYWDTIKARVSHALHRSVSSLTRLWSPRRASKESGGPPPTITIYDLGVQKGLSRQLLRTLEIGAIRAGWNAMVSRHLVTRPRANHEMEIIKAWDPGNLDGYTMYAFGQK